MIPSGNSGQEIIPKVNCCRYMYNGNFLFQSRLFENTEKSFRYGVGDLHRVPGGEQVDGGDDDQDNDHVKADVSGILGTLFQKRFTSFCRRAGRTRRLRSLDFRGELRNILHASEWR